VACRTLTCFAATIAFLLGGGVVGAELVDAVAATVGNEVILYSEIIAQIQSSLDDLRRTAPSREAFESQADALVLQTLEEAIESKILLREALLLGIQVTNEEVDASIEQFRRELGSNEAFMKALQDAGETLSDFRERQRKRLLAGRMYYGKLRDLEKQVIVTEADVAQYYEERRGEFERPEEVRVRQIFLVARSEEDRAKAKARLELLREEIAAGADFAELAKAHSQAPGAEEGGIIGWLRRGDLVPELESAAFGLQKGEVSGVVETANGAHLLKVDERRDAGLRTLEQVRVDIEPLLRSQRAQERYDRWMEELRKRSRVRIFL
jgi:peptidyl-prolyl cis-trans isomerase SurA